MEERISTKLLDARQHRVEDEGWLDFDNSRRKFRGLMMAAFVFLCDVSTEQECLERELFGTNPGEAHRDYYSRVVIGDLLFLYNIETGRLRGPFFALTPCVLNIEPAAWKKTKRNFPWQVRVDTSKTHRTPVSVDEFSKYIPLATTKVGLLPPAELSEEQASSLLAELSGKV